MPDGYTGLVTALMVRHRALAGWLISLVLLTAAAWRGYMAIETDVAAADPRFGEARRAHVDLLALQAVILASMAGVWWVAVSEAGRPRRARFAWALFLIGALGVGLIQATDGLTDWGAYES